MEFLDKLGLQHLWLHIVARLGGKVDKEEGKSLSSNDYTTAEKQKLNFLTVMDEITNAQIDEIFGATIMSGSEVSL